MTELDPEIAAMMPPGEAPAMEDITPQAARAMHGAIGQALAALARPIGPVRDLTIGTPAGPLKLRHYRPEGAGGVLPLTVFLHGGGWVGGDLDTHEVLCRELAHGTGAAVMAVEYRLAPEHPFPAGYEDALAAVKYCLDHAAELEADPARIAVAGDSAGGNLTAAVVQAVRGRPGPQPMFQLLIYPVTDLRCSLPSYVERANAPGLTAAAAGWCISHYLRKAGDIFDLRASPMMATDLSGLPPTAIVTADLDPVRDDGEAYGRRLMEAGVPVQFRRYLGVPHGFLSLPPTIGRTRQGIDDTCRLLAQAFRG